MKTLLIISLCLAMIARAPMAKRVEELPASMEDGVPSSALDGEKEAALLYRGEHVNLFSGRSDDSWGIILEEFTWVGHDLIYQRLPGTSGMDCLHVTEIRSEADDHLSEASFSSAILTRMGKSASFASIIRHRTTPISIRRRMSLR